MMHILCQNVPMWNLLTSVTTFLYLFFFASLQLFQVSSANEWKTISVRDRLAESDEEVLVKCSTWTADGKRIICAARNAVLVGIFQTPVHIQQRLLFAAVWCLLKRKSLNVRERPTRSAVFFLTSGKIKS